MALKLYYDLFSQPSRALYIFLKKTNIPFESKVVNIGKAEHLTPEFLEINPQGKLPAIDHSGFKLSESVAILRYFCREFKVDSHWYPSESIAQAKVDEYLEWQHLNTRLFCAMYFRTMFIMPRLTKEKPDPKEVTEWEGRMEQALDNLETIWLKNKPFLTGNDITIADLLGACEIEQPRLIGYDTLKNRPNLTAWMNRVRKETSPYYDEVHDFLHNTMKQINNRVKNKL